LAQAFKTSQNDIVNLNSNTVNIYRQKNGWNSSIKISSGKQENEADVQLIAEDYEEMKIN
jgi:hypothetical protein